MHACMYVLYIYAQHTYMQRSSSMRTYWCFLRRLCLNSGSCNRDMNLRSLACAWKVYEFGFVLYVRAAILLVLRAKWLVVWKLYHQTGLPGDAEKLATMRIALV